MTSTSMRTSTRNLLWEAYETSRDNRRLSHSWEGDRYVPATWDDWRSAAERAALGLRRRGVQPGMRVAAVLTNSFDVSAGVFATWLAGATLLSLPTPHRGQLPDDYVAQLRQICVSTDAQLLLLERRFLELPGSEALGVPLESFDALYADGPFDPTPPADDEVAFVQFSSGSTGEPVGCMLTMGAIAEQERMIAERVAVDEDAVGVMWLPLSHDLGLFGGLLLNWVTGMQGTLGTPERFLQQPGTWFDDCARFGAQLTMGPSFALALATKRARTRPPCGRIPLRTFVLGGERIEWTTLLEADEVLGPHGVSLATMLPGYGLAEAALGVTMKRPDGIPPRMCSLDANALYRGELVPVPAEADGACALVSCGPPMQGVSVRIDGPDPVGQVHVRSPSLTAGFLGPGAAARAPIADGELATGDLGFLHDDELHIVARIDDVIVTGGRNVFARDAEVLVERCDGVRRGCAALLDLPGARGTRLLLALETRAELSAADAAALAREAAAATYRAVGLRVDECAFFAPGTLPKTPSGKTQRFRCRALLQADADAIVERVTLQ